MVLIAYILYICCHFKRLKKNLSENRNGNEELTIHRYGQHLVAPERERRKTKKQTNKQNNKHTQT